MRTRVLLGTKLYTSVLPVRHQRREEALECPADRRLEDDQGVERLAARTVHGTEDGEKPGQAEQGDPHVAPHLGRETEELWRGRRRIRFGDWR